MAIKKDDNNSTDTQISLLIDNGDFQALNKIYQDWNFKNIEGVLRFALAIMTKAKNETVFIEDDGGEKLALKPADALKKSSTPHDTNQTQ